MAETEFRSQELSTDRKAIERAGRLHLVHWAVVLLSLALTLVAWRFASSQVQQRSEARFSAAAEQVVELLSERMQKYEDGLWGGVSAIQANGGDMSYREWRTFANTLRIDVKYPGINGIGVIHQVKPEDLNSYLDAQHSDRPDYRIHPPHDRSVYMPITFVEPMAANARAVGLDMAHEENRFSAATKARDTGAAQITAPIILVQDKTHTPGFLFFAPYYADGAAATLEERRSNFLGFVYAPFVFSKLMEGVLDLDRRDVRIRVRDADTILYDENAAVDGDQEAEARFKTTATITEYGRTWSFDIWSTPEFLAGGESYQPTVILVGGIFIDALLLTLFVLLTHANRRALRYADRASEELREKARDLEMSNAELERFAYVAAHDLKAPLRAINYMTEFIEDDLDEYLRSPEAKPEVRNNLRTMRGRVERLDHMIKGILEYSCIKSEAVKIEKVDCAQMIRGLATDLGYSEHEIVCDEALPHLETEAVRLRQVFANLLSNAKKYHHRPGDLRVVVSARRVGGFVEFTVADNGPGVAVDHHDRIFDIFQRLHNRDEIEGTGVGLSIVKKTVEMKGGNIRIESAPGEGARFIFKWPNDALDAAQSSPGSRAAA